MTTKRAPVRLKPSRPGLIVKYPDRSGRALDPDGTDVLLNTYWRRRLMVGDVVRVDPPDAPRTRKPKTPATED